MKVARGVSVYDKLNGGLTKKTIAVEKYDSSHRGITRLVEVVGHPYFF